MKSKNKLLCVLATLTMFFLLSNCIAKNDKTQKQGEVAMEEQTNILKAFPTVQAKNLEGDQTTIPDDAKGKVTLVAVAFLQQSQGQLDSWLNPFYENFGKRDDFMFYEIPMIAGGYVFMKPIISSGMRGGLPQFKHKHVVTFFGDVKHYSDTLNIDPGFGHAFLLDKEGVIRWQNKGYAEKDALEDMFSLAKKLAD
jgi:hypothetical protein